MKNSREVLKISAGNKYKRWIPAIESEVGDPRSAQARLARDEYFIAATSPRFRLLRTDSVFTIGSCFARNVEDALLAQGLDLLTKDVTVDPVLLAPGQVGNMASSVRAILNKYSTSAIRNELERALGDGTATPSFIEVGDGQFIDPHLALLKPMPRDVLAGVRAEVDRVIRSLAHADAVFVTLGLTETWYDTETRCFLNGAPPPALLARDRGRFCFENCTVQRAVEDMEAVVDLVARKNPAVKMIVTVSPVPMNTTFTAQDVAVANTYSKSVLRVTAQQLAEKYPFVDYYPSYEMVMNSPRRLAWTRDQLHVQPAMVAAVVENFVKNYIADEAAG